MSHVRNAPARAARPTVAPLDPGNTYIAIWGQSNATGDGSRSDISAAPLSSDAGLADFDAGTFSRVWIWGGSGFEQLQPSVNNGAGSGKFGPEFGIAVRWMRETSAGNLYLQKETVSGAPISTFDPSVWPGSDMFHRAKNGAFVWLSNNAITLAQKHWLWVQGESNSGDSQASYQDALQEIVDAMYSYPVLVAPASRMVLAQMKVGSATYGAGVDAAKAAVAASDPTHIFEVRMDYYQVDNIHCTARGQVQLGYDSFEKLIGGPYIAT